MHRSPQHEESLEQFIASAYRTILKREPDEPGLQHHREALEQGRRTKDEFLLDLVQSEEFLAQFQSSRITTDMTSEVAFHDIYERCRAYTMTSLERMYGLYQAVNYVLDAGVPGDVVECGVWKGGSSMLAARTLLLRNDTSRLIYLFDTFAGMSEPSEEDVRFDGADAGSTWSETKDANNQSTWCNSPVDEVRSNLLSTGYPAERLIFVQGKVEDTIPRPDPSEIAILRLDTDWYESTLHEMRHLYPRLSEGGVVIIDDFGWWNGARKAVEEYLAECGESLLLSRICGCGARMGIKQKPRARAQHTE